MILPLRCRGARCPICRFGWARRKAAQIEAGLSKWPDGMYAVLTVKPENHASIPQAFVDTGDLWRERLHARLCAEYGHVEFVATIEAHRSGWPHWNIAMRSDAMMEHVRELGFEWRRVVGHGGERVARFPYWRSKVFGKLVRASGWGTVFWAEPIVDAQSMAAYLAKLAGEFTRGGSKDGDQRPLLAPKGTRWVRSTPGLLPPARGSSGKFEGVLVDASVEAFVNRVTGELEFDWERFNVVKAMRAATDAARAELDARAQLGAQRWAAMHAVEIVPRWGDSEWSGTAPLLCDVLGPAIVEP
jgi:hypothetical protein